MSHKKTDLGIQCPRKSAKVVLATERGPSFHIDPALPQRLHPPVGPFDLVADGMSQALLHRLARKDVAQLMAMKKGRCTDAAAHLTRKKCRWLADQLPLLGKRHHRRVLDLDPLVHIVVAKQT